MRRDIFHLMPNWGMVTVLAAVVFLFAAPAVIYANGDMVGPKGKAVDGWFPQQEEIGGSRAGLDQANIEVIAGHLEAVEKLLRSAEVLIKEAEIYSSRAIASRPDKSPQTPIPYRLNLRIYRPGFEEARRSGGSISFLVNMPYAMAGILFTDAEGPIYLSRPEVGRVGPFPMYLLSPERSRSRETGWIISPDGRSPWLPVSQERWITALIGDAQEKLNEFESEAVGGAQQRRASFEHSYEGMQRLSPETAEKLREQFESQELQLTRLMEALGADDYDTMEKLGRRDLAMLGRVTVRLKQELAAMPADSRSAPAYCCEASPVGYFAPPSRAIRPSLLVDPDDKRAVALLTPDPDFFRANVPPAAMQSITVTQRITRVDDAWEAYMEDVRQGLDWKAMILLLGEKLP